MCFQASLPHVRVWPGRVQARRQQTIRPVLIHRNLLAAGYSHAGSLSEVGYSHAGSLSEVSYSHAGSLSEVNRPELIKLMESRNTTHLAED